MEDDEVRNQFTFYRSFFEAASKIKSKAARAEAYDAICKYALFNDAPDVDKMSDAAAIAFMLIKPNLDASRRKAKSGKSGGKSKQSGSKAEANDKQEQPASEKEKEKEEEIEIENDSVYGASAPTRAPEQQVEPCQKAKRFTAPTVQEVADYCRERGNQVDAQRFVDYYTANGWRVGKNPMKDWRAAVRTWEKQEGVSPTPVAPRWSKPEIPKGASGQLGEAELEAIQRVLAEPVDD